MGDPGSQPEKGRGRGNGTTSTASLAPVTRIAQSKWPMIYSVEMNDEYTHSDSLNIIQKCLFNTL